MGAALDRIIGYCQGAQYDDGIMEATERRVMTDAELVPQLPAIWDEIRKDLSA